MSLDLGRIRAAHERIRPFIKHTPVMTSERLDDASGAKSFFKCENFQKIGASIISPEEHEGHEVLRHLEPPDHSDLLRFLIHTANFHKLSQG